MLEWIGFGEVINFILENEPWFSNPKTWIGFHKIVVLVLTLIGWVLSIFPFSLFLVILGFWIMLLAVPHIRGGLRRRYRGKEV